MKREVLADLAVFAAVADEGNFTRAAIRLGVSQSAVSHTMRRLENAIGIRLLNRSSRRVSTTDAGEQVLAALRPSLHQIDTRIEEVRHSGDAPGGLIRITASKTAIRTILWPVASRLVQDYPQIRIEISSEGRLADLVEDRFDCGIRLREHVGPDMIAVQVGAPLELALVASPKYCRDHGVPLHPVDLYSHRCIGLRFRPHDAVYEWELEKDGKEVIHKVSGPFIFNDSDLAIEATMQGHGIACVTLPEVSSYLSRGDLIRVLADWCPPFEGFCLYYSSRRQVSSALRILIENLRL